MIGYEIILLSRSVDAYAIPSGARFHLVAGTEVIITQDRGDNYTVSVHGNLFRIDGKDADALGRAVNDVLAELPFDVDIESYVWSQLKSCYDPEIPINIVDLGLIYECKITELLENQRKVDVKMTLTAPGCGMGPVLVSDVKQKLLAIPSIVEVNVELVFDPPWDRSKISDAAKLELGIF